jgi:hypothetical protein
MEQGGSECGLLTGVSGKTHYYQLDAMTGCQKTRRSTELLYYDPLGAHPARMPAAVRIRSARLRVNCKEHQLRVTCFSV